MAALGNHKDEQRHLQHKLVSLPEMTDTSQPTTKECAQPMNSADAVLTALQRCKSILLYTLDTPSTKWSELHNKDG